MHKTLHKKLTGKHSYEAQQPCGSPEDMPGYAQEMNMLRTAAKDLMQPRPEAVASLLRMAREI